MLAESLCHSFIPIWTPGYPAVDEAMIPLDGKEEWISPNRLQSLLCLSYGNVPGNHTNLAPDLREIHLVVPGPCSLDIKSWPATTIGVQDKDKDPYNSHNGYSLYGTTVHQETLGLGSCCPCQLTVICGVHARAIPGPWTMGFGLCSQ